MEKKSEIDEILVKECMNQQLTVAEQATLGSWLKQDKRHRKILAQMKLAFLYPNAENRKKIQNEVWVDLQNRLVSKNTLSGKAQKRNYWIRVAVVAAILLSVGLAIFQINDPFGSQRMASKEVRMIEKVSLPGQKVTTLLPDGTIVKLNAGSRIIVPERFVDNRREVTLFGEAFFEVTKDKSRPFMINTKDIKVEVLGTSFNVRSYPGKDYSTVAVATGTVAVTSGEEQEHLIAGEKISYQSALGKMEKAGFDWEQEFGWKENLLVFEGSDFAEIMEKLSSWYGVEFTVEGEIHDLNKLFSGRYQDPTLNAVLEGLSYVYDFDYQINKKKIILKTKSN